MAGTRVQLTDNEMMALADIDARGELGLTSAEIANPARVEAGASLGRFGLITRRYPDGKVISGYAVWWVSGTGELRLHDMHRAAAAHHPCCQHMILLPCVCSYRSYCPEHGGGCHGTHD